MMTREQLKASIEDTQERISGLQEFINVTNSADIPDELKAQFKQVCTKEIAFLEGILEDDLNAL